MAIEGIDISLSEVSSIAERISKVNDNLDLKLADIKKEMDNLENAWQSDASSTIRGNFNALLPRFNEYKEVINSYVTFLRETVRIYGEAETSINNNASAFK